MFDTTQILFILIFFFTFTHSQYSEMVNVGTILFSDVDNSRTCWSNEQLALLRARMIYQDILPQDNVINMKDDRFITDLVTYFKMAVEKVKKMATGKTKQLNLMALTDTIGGYLRHIILPMARHGFYSGNLNYASTGKLYDLYSELKSYLRTDGSTWAAPKKGSFFKQKRQIDALPEAVEGSVNGDPCSGLIFSEGTDSGIVIPMPFFDLQSEPSAIAVPFKTNPLRNIISKNSAFVLVKFYMAATKCLQSKNADKKSTDRFTFEFNHFLDQQVLPRLDDERLYPAFGSVYRIKESLDKGLYAITKMAEIANCFAIPTKAENAPSNETNTEEAEICLDKSSTVIFSAIGGTAVLWAVITTLYCLLRKSKSNDPSSGRPSTRSVGGMSLSNKGGSFGAPSKTTCPAKVNIPQSDNCIKCKKSTCTDPKSAKDSKTTNFVTSVTSYFRKNSSRTIKSVSISGSKSHSSMVVQRMFPTSKTSSSSTTTTTTTNADKPMVFGYDFETSTSESDSEESSESSHPV